MPKVSVLVPLYGVERYIAQCARSLMRQSYENCEFIFVNDASTDSSMERLNEVLAEFPLRSNQIKIVDLEANGGVAAARNIALDSAKGEYLLFVDADDWVDTELVERLILRAVECDADICNAWCADVDSIGNYKLTPMCWVGSNISHLKAVLGQSHIVHNHVRGMLIRRSIIEDNRLRFTSGVDFGEDYSLLPQLLYHAQKLSTVPYYLYLYRVENRASYMNNIGERHIASYIAAQRIVTQFVESLPKPSQYHRSLELGRLNIKKWLFWRGVDPKLYNEQLFGSRSPKIQSPLLRLYNRAIDSGSEKAVRAMSIVVNLPLYIRSRLSR